jgi:hypothetical protein
LFGQSEIAMILIEAGAKVDVKNSQGTLQPASCNATGARPMIPFLENTTVLMVLGYRLTLTLTTIPASS